jgi:hypothetical protein
VRTSGMPSQANLAIRANSALGMGRGQVQGVGTREDIDTLIKLMTSFEFTKPIGTRRFLWAPSICSDDRPRVRLTGRSQ